MSTTDTIPPRPLPPLPEYDQIVKGDVSIKKLSKYRYRITFRKIGKFLVYQVWDKDNVGNLNSNRFVNYLSAENWVKVFNIRNRNLEQNNKPLFTPTTIMETVDDVAYTFVINKAYLNKSGHVVFTVSTKEIKSSLKKIIKIPSGKFNNIRFDIDAPNRYTAEVVYNVSDCGYPNVRWYCCGGAGPANPCDRWVINEWSEAMWKAIPPISPEKAQLGKPPYDYNWMMFELDMKAYRYP